MAESSFSHHPNRDGTWDAICPHCYRTIATATDPIQLRAREHEHRCTPEGIERRPYDRIIGDRTLLLEQIYVDGTRPGHAFCYQWITSASKSAHTRLAAKMNELSELRILSK
jgi:hypothetical protein